MLTVKDVLSKNGNEFLSEWDDHGAATYYAPWQTAVQDNPYSTALARTRSSLIDLLLLQEYGDRPASYILKTVYNAATDTIDKPALKALAWKVLDIFYTSWMRLTADYIAQYDPVQNYSMTEHGTDKTDKDGVGVVNAHSKELDVSRDSETKDISYEATGDDYQVLNRPVGSTTAIKTNSYDGTLKDTQENTTTYNNPNNNEGYTKEQGVHGTSNDYSDREFKEHDFQRAGNIGVMTATQMIEKDTEFWSSHDFFSQIASDVASIISDPYYE